MMNKDIPVLSIKGKTLPEAWEKAVLCVWEKGIEIKTEYDKPTSLPSKDATVIILVEEPFTEPRIHRAIPCGLEDLEIYRQEVLYGIHDHWINPAEGKWTYTYHKRLFCYEIEGEVIDQINYITQLLSRKGYSRRAQAVTWNSKLDPPTEDCPCLQRIWCRLTESEGGLTLNMNSHWRSRDAYKASFMNMFALTELMKLIAKKISKLEGKPVSLGRYVDISDSFHIYGSYADEFKNFVDMMHKRDFSERTWSTEFAQPFFEQARKKIEAEGKDG